MFCEEYLWFYISYLIVYICIGLSQRDYKDQTFFFNIVCFEFGDSGHCCIMFHSYAYFYDMLNSLMITGGVQFYNEYESLGSKDSYQYECLRSGNVSNLIF